MARVRKVTRTVASVIFLFMCLTIVVLVYLAVLKISYRWQEVVELKDRRIIDFRIDSSFTAKERIKIENALRRWEIATKGHVILRHHIGDVTITDLFQFISDGVPTIYKAVSLFSWKKHLIKIGPDSSSANTIGLSLTFTGDLFILESNNRFEDLIVHEVGHVLINTLWHSENLNSVMHHTVCGKGKKCKILEDEIDLVVRGRVTK